jgi:hypothetical protein
MPAIRAIYFSTRALEKKRGSIFEKRLEINVIKALRATLQRVEATRLTGSLRE